MKKAKSDATPNAGRTPQERTAQARKLAEQRHHIGGSNYEPIPASEFASDGRLTPWERAASRQGTKYEPSHPHKNVNEKGRVQVRKETRAKTEATHGCGLDQSADRTDYQMLTKKTSHPNGERKTGSAFGQEVKKTVKF